MRRFSLVPFIFGVLPACAASLSGEEQAGGRAGSSAAGAAGASAGLGGVAGQGGHGGSGGAAGTAGGGGGGAGGAAGSAGLGGSAGTGAVGGVGGTGGVGDPHLELVGTSPFRRGARAAYTIIHDDLCDPNANGQVEHGDAELTKRGLRAAFGAIVKQCVDTDAWDTLQTLTEHGHEILNHSWSHIGVPMRDLAAEVDQARDVLESNVPGLDVTFFIFPYDLWDDPSLAHVRTAGYLGARAGIRGWNSPDFPDDFGVAFDVYGPGFSFYVKQMLPGPCLGVAEATARDSVPLECRQFVMQDYVDQAIQTGSWGVRELHGVLDKSWEAIPLDEYVSHLDYVKAKVDLGELWVDPPTAVIRYRRTREHCFATFGEGILDFGSPSAECLRFAVPLSFVFRPVGFTPNAVRATQGGTATFTLKLPNGDFVVEAEPNSGPVTVVPE